MYYNTHGQKSNKIMKVGILQGKKALYNQLILQSLVLGKKTTMEISAYIAQNDSKCKTCVKSIFSIIDRKGGRLQELSEKHYIEREEKKWGLTIKGIHIALFQSENLLDQFLSVLPLKDYDNIDLDTIKQNIMLPPILSRYINVKKFKNKYMEYVFSKQFWINRLRIAGNMINAGVDLDKLSEMEFYSMVGNLTLDEVQTLIEPLLKKGIKLRSKTNNINKIDPFALLK